jgi:hypothetical protein
MHSGNEGIRAKSNNGDNKMNFGQADAPETERYRKRQTSDFLNGGERSALSHLNEKN